MINQELSGSVFMPFVNRQGQRMALPFYYPNFEYLL